MFRAIHPQRYLSLPDLLIFGLIGAIIYGLIAFGNEWRAEFTPVTHIDLSIRYLPMYAFFSAMRGIIAYCLSLAFTFAVGYMAARSPKAERVILPLLDILQSIPVLGFMPGLVIGLIALFPNSNTGLELSAIIMIFTGQVWNMVFSFYSSLKSVPADIQDASTIMGLNVRNKLFQVELPFAAMDLAWNSLISMAGGWFFLSICEAFTLGDQDYRLPGIGAYMAVAIQQGNTKAICLGIAAMISIIVIMDSLIWRPILSWAYRYRTEDIPGISKKEPLIQFMIRESKVRDTVRYCFQFTKIILKKVRLGFLRLLSIRKNSLQNKDVQSHFPFQFSSLKIVRQGGQTFLLKGLGRALSVACCVLIGYGSWKLFQILIEIPFPTWGMILKGTLFTFSRIFFALCLACLWAIPLGVWIGTSSKRVHIAQPIIQILASFPAPMLYPLVIAISQKVGLPFGLSAVFLLTLGIQWYILFNVLSGALRISQELKDMLVLMNIPKVDLWRKLYLPSIFPTLVTGLLAASGGAWNACIVAEYISYDGRILSTLGLGSLISTATSKEDFHLLAGSLTTMVTIVILMNRTLWAKVYHLAHTRFKVEI